jgi:putative transposase
MNFTKEQLSDVLIKHLDKENGLQDRMQLMIEKKITVA